MTTAADWRARVEKELAGRSFDKVLVDETLEGIRVQPLYVEAPTIERSLGDGAPFRICMRHEHGGNTADVQADLDGGAGGLWLGSDVSLPPKIDPNVLVIVDDSETSCLVGGKKAALVSTLAFHDAGADASAEIALALAATVERIAAGATSLCVRVAIGRDTFLELSKIRALRIGLRKVVAAFTGTAVAPLRIHAVCSDRTLTERDPWVNMLRVTTQMFAAILGGADLVTPNAFDRLLETPSDLGRRVARNTGHVLREESALGRVRDPGAGSYYIDTVTDALAREAWSHFQTIERAGGLTKCLENGSIDAQLEVTRKKRQTQIATRKLPVVGVSEFANLGEHLPSAPRAIDRASDHRDAAAFESLRTNLESLKHEVLLVPLGTPSESRPRIEFARALFATAGVEAIEKTVGDALGSVPDVVCLCGTDESYAAHAVEIAAELREAGTWNIALAGRPGELEKPLREAGVQGFIFLGCDVIAVLTSLFASTSKRKVG